MNVKRNRWMDSLHNTHTIQHPPSLFCKISSRLTICRTTKLHHNCAIWQTPIHTQCPTAFHSSPKLNKNTFLTYNNIFIMLAEQQSKQTAEKNKNRWLENHLFDITTIFRPNYRSCLEFKNAKCL